MCTVTWTVGADGYHLFFSRDEQRTRATADPPAYRFDGDGNRFLAPLDPDGGGSWISVNPRGLTICVLNAYTTSDPGDGRPPRSPEGPFRSRGRLPVELAACGGASEIAVRLERDPPRQYRPFILLACEPGAWPMAWEWTGERLIQRPAPAPPLTTSSWSSERVAARRRRTFLRMCPRPGASVPLERLLGFHRSTDARSPAAGVAMRREDAETVSLTHVAVPGRSGTAVMRYFPGNPGDGPGATTHVVELPLAGSADPVARPGEDSPGRVSRRTFDVESVFREKAPELSAKLPRPALRVLDRLAYRRTINRALHEMRSVPCRAFPAAALARLGVEGRIAGAAPPPPEARPIFVANHPLGGLDGLVMLAWLLQRYPEVRVPANDVLAGFPHLRPFLSPLDWFGRRRAGVRALRSTFAGSAAVLLFPAGRTSRYVDGRLRDAPWGKLAARMAIEHDRPVVPVFIDARNSRRFYGVARVRNWLGVRTNLEMLLLVDEMMRPGSPAARVSVGAAVAPERLARWGGSHEERARSLRMACYRLENGHVGETAIGVHPADASLEEARA